MILHGPLTSYSSANLKSESADQSLKCSGKSASLIGRLVSSGLPLQDRRNERLREPMLMSRPGEWPSGSSSFLPPETRDTQQSMKHVLEYSQFYTHTSSKNSWQNNC